MVRKLNLIKNILIEQMNDFKRALKSHIKLLHCKNIIFENIDSNNSILKISIFKNLSAPSGANKQRFAL